MDDRLLTNVSEMTQTHNFFVLIFMLVSIIAEERQIDVSYPSVCMSALCLSVCLSAWNNLNVT